MRRKETDSVIKTIHFPQGDTYQGQWKESLPHGYGIYNWQNGSFYEGEWKSGLLHGTGKYQWPSFATYTGEWVLGNMHGTGIFESPDGNKYQGGWNRDQKHGLGKKTYSNGDLYEGLWQMGKHNGPGRYVWVDGNVYDGEWKNSKMHGQGTFVWQTQERYDGEWKDGVEHGLGVFSSEEGSYEGTWKKGRRHGVGILFPASRKPPMQQTQRIGYQAQDDTNINNGRQKSNIFNTMDDNMSDSTQVSTRRQKATSDSQVKNSQKVDDKTKRGVSSSREPLQDADRPIQVPEKGNARNSLEDGNIQHTSVYTQQQQSNILGQDQICFIREYRNGDLKREYQLPVQIVTQILGQPRQPIQGYRRKFLRKSTQKRTGETIFKGHASYDLMISLQFGIRYSVTKVESKEQPKRLEMDDFRDVSRVNFPNSGSDVTAPHKATDFTWKDYSPQVFRKLREVFDVDVGEYLLSICGDKALIELSSPGKSGSMFYISHDEKFLIKTMKTSEIKLLQQILPQYYKHMDFNRHSMLIRFYGLHRIGRKGGQQIRFVVMGNVFSTDLLLHNKFDLKGSTQGRSARSSGKVEDFNTILKDNDLDFKLSLENSWNQKMLSQLRNDCSFLEHTGVMDYSLLLGIHHTSQGDGNVQNSLERNEQDDDDGPVNSEYNNNLNDNNKNNHSFSSSTNNNNNNNASYTNINNNSSSLNGNNNNANNNNHLSISINNNHSAHNNNNHQHSNNNSMSFHNNIVNYNMGTTLPNDNGTRQGSTVDLKYGRFSTSQTETPHIYTSLGRQYQQLVTQFNEMSMQQLKKVEKLMVNYKIEEQQQKDLAQVAIRKILQRQTQRPKEYASKIAVSKSMQEDDDINQLALALGHNQLILGQGMLAKCKKYKDKREDQVLLYFGIIDILQDYNIRKKVEHQYKSVFAKGVEISSVNPYMYSQRFQNFMKHRVFDLESEKEP